MKKRIFALCIVLAMLVMTICVSAESVLLDDSAKLLTESEHEEILKLLEEVSERQDVDVVICTVDEHEDGMDVDEAAIEWYEENIGKDTDGVMLFISMEERDSCIMTSGYGITAITDAGVDYIYDKFIDALSDGEYAGAFKAYIKYTDEFITQAKTGKPYDTGHMPREPYNLLMSLVVSLVVGFIVSGVITGMWKSQLKSVAFQTRATNYIKAESFHVANARDLFLYRTVDRVKKETKSSGGSTTHKSASGGTYGGKSRKF